METKEANMAKKQTASALVDGMFMGAAFLKALTDEVVALGGYAEQIHFLTTERGKELLYRIAELIAKAEWRVPRSLMERLITLETGIRSMDRYHWWGLVLNGTKYGLKVPERYFDANNNRELGFEPIPQEVVDQLRGMIRPADVIVIQLDGEDHVVTQLEAKAPEEIGKPLFTRDEELEFVDLAPAKYFDLTR